MSYADKKAKPQCAALRCTNDGTKIVLAGGRPAWFCEACAEKVKK